MRELTIVADENIPLLDDFFGDMGVLHKFDGRHITPDQVAQADVLVLRSVTQVNADLLQHSTVQFVGTCTSGSDHLDIPWLECQGIAWRHAPGCNAPAVGDYVIACLSHLWQTRRLDPRNATIGIVAAGHVGSGLANRLRAAGLSVIQNDPPLQQQGRTGLASLDELLQQADIVCLHAPLDRTGSHPTDGLLNARKLGLLRPGTALINAGRGELVNQAALLQRLEQQGDLHVYFDVWCSEPEIDLAILPYLAIATPHIAGYSLEGKMRGTAIIYKQLCQHFGQTALLQLADLMPQPALIGLQVSETEGLAQILRIACNAGYSLVEDDARLRYTLHQASRNHSDITVAAAFDYQRKHYPTRRELSNITVSGLKNPRWRHFMNGLGFSLDDA